MTVQERLDKASGIYNEAAVLISSMGEYVRARADIVWDTKTMLGEFDLILQAILMHIALSNGRVDPAEKEFIARISQRADILSYLRARTGNRINLSWNDFSRMDKDSAGQLMEHIDRLLRENVCDAFVRPLAVGDFIDSDRDELGMLEKMISRLAALLTSADEYDPDRLHLAYAKSVAELLGERWRYYKENPNADVPPFTISDFFHRSAHHQAAFPDDGHLVAELLGHFQHVGGEEYGAARIAVLAHQAFEQVRGYGIEAYERFVHDDEPGRVQPGGYHRQLLLHAVGIGADGLGEILFQLQHGGKAVDALLALLFAHAEDVGDEVQVLYAAHKVVQVRIVRDKGQAALAFQGICAHGYAVHVNLAAVEAQDAHAAFEGGGLAGAVVADKAVDLAGLDVEGQIVHGLLFAVALGKVFDSQHTVAPSGMNDGLHGVYH